MAQTLTNTLRPLHDPVVVKRVEEGGAKRASIFIFDPAQEEPHEGEVIAVGPGRITDDGRHLTPAIKRGDRIVFGKYSGSEVKLDGLIVGAMAWLIISVVPGMIAMVVLCCVGAALAITGQRMLWRAPVTARAGSPR